MAEVNPIFIVVGLTGVEQGVQVVNVCIEDHADTELLSLEHAERTCHSYVVEELNPVFWRDVSTKLSINVVQVDDPWALNRTS